MTIQHIDADGNVYGVSILGPNLQTQLTPVIGVIAPGQSASSALMSSGGMNSLTVAATLNQAGSLVINRYLDRQGSILAAAASTTAMVANTPLLVTINDDAVFQSFKLTITNSAAPSGGETELNGATPTHLLAVLQLLRPASA